jgi:hypothetical protein
MDNLTPAKQPSKESPVKGAIDTNHNSVHFEEFEQITESQESLSNSEITESLES